MQKTKSSIIMYKRGNEYICDTTGAFGGGYSGAPAGDTIEKAALFALREEQRYIKTNPEGGEMFLPAEVQKWIDDSTHTVRAKLTPSLYDALKLEAHQDQITIEEYAERAIADYID